MAQTIQDISDDFSDLEELLSESVAKASIIRAGKDAESKLRRGSLSDEAHSDALATIHAAELIHTWESVVDIVAIEQVNCEGCGSSHQSIIGFFNLQRHRRESGGKRVLRIEAPADMSKTFSYMALRHITVCPECFTLPPLHEKLVKEFTVLTQFAANPL